MRHNPDNRKSENEAEQGRRIIGISLPINRNAKIAEYVNDTQIDNSVNRQSLELHIKRILTTIKQHNWKVVRTQPANGGTWHGNDEWVDADNGDDRLVLSGDFSHNNAKDVRLLRQLACIYNIVRTDDNFDAAIAGAQLAIEMIRSGDLDRHSAIYFAGLGTKKSKSIAAGFKQKLSNYLYGNQTTTGKPLNPSDAKTKNLRQRSISDADTTDNLPRLLHERIRSRISTTAIPTEWGVVRKTGIGLDAAIAEAATKLGKTKDVITRLLSKYNNQLPLHKRIPLPKRGRPRKAR